MIAMTARHKLLEAGFKDKEIDPYFCLGLVVGTARQSFILEISKAAEVYIEACDNSNSCLVVKKLHRNLRDNHHMR